jgi:hypothetical protein
LDDVRFYDSDDGALYSYTWDTDNWSYVSPSFGIEIGSNEVEDSYIEDITISNNYFDDADDGMVIRNNIIYGEGGSVYFKEGEEYVLSPPKGTIKGVKGVDTGGGKIILKGCEAIEMKNLSVFDVEIDITDSKNIDMSYSDFRSSVPLKDSMIVFDGDTHHVELSHSMFNVGTSLEELPSIYSSVDMIATVEQPKQIKNVKEDVTMATSLSLTLWLMVFVVAVTAAVFAKKANWRTLLWPIKKLFKRAEAEGKKVEEEWKSIE